MEARNKHRDTPASRPVQPEPYGALRKRNERRARIARLLDAQRKHLSDIDRVMRLQRERKVRPGR